MEINKPDRGVFKGVGPLQRNIPINRKPFPKIRNIHQFQYTHNHQNAYLSSSNYFHKSKFGLSKYEKVNKNANQSSIVFGSDKHKAMSLNKSDFKKYQNIKPTRAVNMKQEGFDLGQPKVQKNHFNTTNLEKFNPMKLSDKMNIAYRDTRSGGRFNPITGQFRKSNISGFEDFSMGKNNTYKANNFTVIPQGRQRFDIISGRKLTHQ